MTGTYTETPVSPIGDKNRETVHETALKVAELMQCNPVEVELALLKAMTGAVEVTHKDGKHIYRFSWDT